MRRTVLGPLLAALGLLAGLAPAARAGLDAWTVAGPTGATTSTVARHGALVLLGTHPDSLRGGIWRSGDGGATWARAAGDESTAVFDIAVDPSRPDRVYAATRVGLLRSLDGGRTWARLSSTTFPAGQAVFEVALDPATPGNGYVVVRASAATVLSLHRFEDGGDGPWTRLPNPPTIGTLSSVAVDPDDAAVWVRAGGDPYRLRAASGTWSAVTDGLPADASVHDLIVSPVGAGRVWVTTLSATYSLPSGGGTWTLGPTIPPTTDWVPLRLAADPAGQLFAMSREGVPRRASVGEETWVPASTGLPPGHGASVVGAGGPTAVDTGVAGRLVAVVQGDRPLWGSADAGRTWAPLPGQPVAGSVRALAASRRVPGSVLASMDGTLVRSDDGGVTWEILAAPSGVFAIDADVRAGRWYVTTGGAMYRSEDGGRTFTVLGGDAPGGVPLATDPSTPGRLWAGGKVSRDAGRTWTPLPPVPGGPDVLDYVGDAGTPGAVWVLTEDGPYRLGPGAGEAWERRAGGLPAGEVRAMAQAPGRPASLVAVVDRRTPYRSDDGGATWTSAAGGLPDALLDAVLADPEQPGVWYAATRSGVYRSTDGARTWARLGADAPTLALAADASGRTLYAGRSPGGVAVRTRGVVPRALAGPTVSGPARRGALLTGAAGRWDGTPEPRLAEAWLRCTAGGGRCVAIPRAAATSYRPRVADIGRRLRYRVTATNALGSVTATSAPTARVRSRPVLRRAPRWRGRARVGRRLVATRGVWAAYPGARLRVRWERCDRRGRRCRLVARATGSVYRLRPADVGRRVRVRVVASNALGRTVARSRLTGVVRGR